jgi:hypothetical protein
MTLEFSFQDWANHRDNDNLGCQGTMRCTGTAGGETYIAPTWISRSQCFLPSFSDSPLSPSSRPSALVRIIFCPSSKWPTALI